MKSVDSLSFLRKLQQQVDAQIQQTIQLSHLDEEILDRPATTGGWSITQCFAHLVSYSDYYLPLLTTALSRQTGPDPTGMFFSSWLGGYLTRLMSPQTGLTKFKAARRHQPGIDLTARAIVTTFVEQQQQLLDLLSLAENTNITTVRIPLSIATWIRLPVGDVLHFMVVHTERHLQQAERNV